MWTNRQETQSRKSLMKGKDSSTLSVIRKNCNIKSSPGTCSKEKEVASWVLMELGDEAQGPDSPY